MRRITRAAQSKGKLPTVTYAPGRKCVIIWASNTARVGLRFIACKGGEAMSQFFSYFVNEFYVFALTALGMFLAYLSKKNDKQDKQK
jgi:hypothetical protein